MLVKIKNQFNTILYALFLQKRRLYTMPLIALLMSALLLAVPLPAAASLWSLLAELVLWIAKLIGGLVVTLIDILIQIVQYNDFINAPAVVKGWVIVRDVVNMFIIVMMLVIAFATTFRIEEYQYKKLLSKLLIMAVLVNFSKMLTGFFIDFAQVIMLTFVNGFKEAAAGNFVNGFRIKEMYEFAKNTDAAQSASGGDFLVAALLALISLTITLVVVAVYLVIFLLRIVFLWLLTIISPLAYILSAFPGQAKKYSSEWWDYFGKYVTTGPILAFFLWLALAVMQFESDTFGTAFKATDTTSEQGLQGVVGASISKFGQSDVLLSFIINIILLLGGLWMAQRLGVAGGKLAGSALNKLQTAGAAIAKAPFKGIGKVGKVAGKWGLERVDDFQARLQQKFMQGKLGQKVAKTEIGKRFGLGKIAEHGIQFRTLAKAWKARNERKERERLGEAAGVAEDIIGRIRSLGGDKTNKSLEMRRRLVQEELKEISSVSTDKDYGLHEYMESTEEYTTEDGRIARRAKKGKEAKVEAILSMLGTNHDFNEVFKDGKLGAQYGMEVTPQGFVQLLKDLYGGGRENEQVARVAFNMQEIGLANSDGWAKGTAAIEHGKFVLPDYFEAATQEKMKQDKNLTHEQASEIVLDERKEKLKRETQDSHCIKELGKNYDELGKEKREAEEKGDTEMVTMITEVMTIADKEVDVKLNQTSVEKLKQMINSEMQAAVAAAFMAKREGRNIVNKARFQDAFVEVADKNGNRTAGALSDVGKVNIGFNGKALATHWDFATEETKRYYAQNLDLIVKYYEENIRNLNDAEEENFRFLISAVAKGSRVLNERDLLGKEQIEATINQYAPNRVKELENISRNREADGLPTASGYTLPVYHPKLTKEYEQHITEKEEEFIEEKTPKKVLDYRGEPYSENTPPYSYGKKE